MQEQKTVSSVAPSRNLSDLGDRGEQLGRVRPVFRSFAKNSRHYLTKGIGAMGRSPIGAVDQPQVRQAPRAAGKPGGEPDVPGRV